MTFITASFCSYLGSLLEIHPLPPLLAGQYGGLVPGGDVHEGHEAPADQAQPPVRGEGYGQPKNHGEAGLEEGSQPNSRHLKGFRLTNEKQ